MAARPPQPQRRPRRGRPGQDRGGDGDSAWLTTFSDLMMLLLAFFVILFSFSELDASLFRVILEGLVEFGNPGAPIDDPPTVEDLLDDPDVAEQVEAELDRIVGADFDEQMQLMAALLGDIDLDLDEDREDGEEDDAADRVDGGDRQVVDDFSELLAALEAAVADADMDDIIDLEVDQRGLVISIGTDEVLFATGSAAISPLGRDLIAVVAPPLRDVGNDVRVEGHTDTVPFTGGARDNWDLAVDRSMAVMRLLEGTYDLPPQRLSATSFGEHRPVADNTTADGRQRNRRVEILVAAPDD